MNEFYSEIEKNLCMNFTMGRNLDAFNDVLRGGFEMHEYGETINLVWKNSEKSRISIGSEFNTIVEIIKENGNVNLILA
jgi:RNAse (barnase) inhibitor barstar